MPITALFLVLLGALIHAGWNIVAKKAHGDARFTFFSGIIMAVVWAPLAIWLGWNIVPTWGFKEWALIAAHSYRR
jgi:drug/metabolite transporter (DMT)-like permease